MSLRARLGAFLLRGAPELRAASTAVNPALLVPAGQVGLPAWNSWSVERAIADGYAAHAVVYACVRRLATDASSVPWQMVDAANKPLLNHRGSKLIAHPNDMYSWQDLIELLTLDLNLGGNGYWWHDAAGQSGTLWRLRPDRVRPVPGPDGRVSHYRHTVSGLVTKIDPEQVIHFRFFDPGNDFVGMSPLRAAARLVDTDNEAIDSNKAALQNQATPSGALIAKGGSTKEQIGVLRDLLKERAEGPANARCVLVLGGPDGLEWQQFGLSPLEMDYIKSMQWDARAICAVFGVHPESIGVVEATYENKRAARRGNWEDTIIPFLGDQKSALNLNLAARLGGGALFDYDLSQTPATIESRRERADEATKYFSMGFAPRVINEHLGLGFNPADCPESGFISAILMPIGSSSLAASSLSRRRSVNLHTEEQRAAHWRRFDRERQAWERGVTETVRTRFQAEGEQLVAAVMQGHVHLDAWIDRGRQDWTDMLTATWRAVVEHFGNKTWADLGLGGRSVRAAWDPWKGLVLQHVEQTVGENVVGIGETTKAALRDTIAKGLAANEDTAQIAARVRETYDGFDTYRSHVIARTEVGGAANYGSHAAAEDSGVAQTHIWISSRDDRVRDSHAAIDGEEVPLKQRFTNGLLHPGEMGGDPAETILCRCAEGYGVGQGEDE